MDHRWQSHLLWTFQVMTQTAPCMICSLCRFSSPLNRLCHFLESNKALADKDFMCQNAILEELRLKMRIRFPPRLHFAQIYLVSYFNFGQKLIVDPPLFQCKFQDLVLLFDWCNSIFLPRLIKMASFFCFYFICSQCSDCMKKVQGIFLHPFHIHFQKFTYLEWQPFDFSKWSDFDFIFSVILFWKITDSRGRRSFAGWNSWERLT